MTTGCRSSVLLGLAAIAGVLLLVAPGSTDNGMGFLPFRDPKTGFVVGGKNPTALVAKLTELNGRTIKDLEADMRPGAYSTAGFLGPEESLVEVLVADNQYVVDELGLTHQELAKHLIMVCRTGVAMGGTPFLYHGRGMKIHIDSYFGEQESPFQDGTSTCRDATVWNLDKGTSLQFSLLVPLMIERYGFYEGHGTSYRVDPRAILAVFDFLTEGPLTEGPLPEEARPDSSRFRDWQLLLGALATLFILVAFACRSIKRRGSRCP